MKTRAPEESLANEPPKKRAKKEMSQLIEIKMDERGWNYYLVFDLFQIYPDVKRFEKNKDYQLNDGSHIKLSHSLTCRTINLLQLPETDHALLGQLIDHYLIEYKLAPGQQPYFLHSEQNDEIIFCELSHWLTERGTKESLQRVKETHTEGRRFEMYTMAEPGKSGTYAKVYPSLATLIYRPDKTFLIKYKENSIKRIIKQHKLFTNPEAIQEEYELASKMKDLHVKPTLGNTMVMDYIPEMDLRELITKDRDGSNPLRLKERCNLAIRLCKAVKLVHKEDIIHLDLKPENIRVKKIQGAYFPFVIDFGLAKRMSNENPAFVKQRGTFYYMSPEVYHGDFINQKADVFSLSKIIAELFGYDIQTIKNEDELKKAFLGGLNFNNLFNYIPELDIRYRKLVKKLLENMSESDVEYRLSLDDAEKEVKEIYELMVHDLCTQVKRQQNLLKEKLKAATVAQGFSEKFKESSSNQRDVDAIILVVQVLEKLLKILHGELDISFTLEEKAAFSKSSVFDCLAKYETQGFLPSELFAEAELVLEFEKYPQKLGIVCRRHTKM